MRNELNEEDRIKLDTWYYVTNLLDLYHELAFEPMYQRGLKWLASAEDKKLREDKISARRALGKGRPQQ
jgi:hypothetical protein